MPKEIVNKKKHPISPRKKIVSVAKAIKSKAKKRQSPKGRSKRIKKKPYEPEDFSMHEVERIEIMAGRGKKLKDFPSVKSSIEHSKRTKEEILAAHRFVFGKKGKYSKKELKDHLLNFSGFLKPIPTGKKRTDDDVNKDEEAIETKYSKRAFAMNKAQIMELCKFFDLDLFPTKDEPKMDKDTCIDRLLDFLGAPHSDWLNPSVDVKKSSTKLTSKKKTSSSTRKPTPMTIKPTPTTIKPTPMTIKPTPTRITDYATIKAFASRKTKNMPTDDVLRAWVRSYLACFNLDKATTKHAIMTCSEKFGVDMTRRKTDLKILLADEM